jgi:hypothetical protein
MKKWIPVLFFVVALKTNAQTVLNNAIITAKVETQREMSGDNEGMMIRTPGDTEVKILLKDSMSKILTSNEMFNSIILVDRKAGTVTNLNESMGEKTGYITTALDREDQKRRMDSTAKANAEAGMPNGAMVIRVGGPSNVKSISYVDETKEINGIQCKKAIAIVGNPEGEDTKVTVWYSDAYQMPKNVSSGRGVMNFTGLNGLPIEYQMIRTMQLGSNEMTLTTTYQVKEIKTNATIDDKEFTIPKGYKVKSYAEWLKDNPGGMPQPRMMMRAG